MSLFWSLKGKKHYGRAYWNTESASIFINKILATTDNYMEFLIYLLETKTHESLHLFLKFRLGKWHCSEKRVIKPLSSRICEALIYNAPSVAWQWPSEI